MARLTKFAWALVGLIGCGGAAAATPTQQPRDEIIVNPARFELRHVPGGYVRFDRDGGTVMFCTAQSVGLKCWPATLVGAADASNAAPPLAGLATTAAPTSDDPELGWWMDEGMPTKSRVTPASHQIEAIRGTIDKTVAVAKILFDQAVGGLKNAIAEADKKNAERSNRAGAQQ